MMLWVLIQTMKFPVKPSPWWRSMIKEGAVVIFLWTVISFFWNCQGAGHPRFDRIVKEYIREHKQCIMTLVKTRLSEEKVDKVIAKLGFPFSHRIKENSSSYSSVFGLLLTT
ncbi:hypothetical protein ES332_D10G202900v1 [Gossypium tomentosum]|uniref:Uncharacterized protein n=1 Tax=Gossypium tomentosum TaxID=34277 RepID=A0A5D2J7I2_GOSTO|nr:hypothetical protein ES332_D10G202900v1 [Gossypium tomentosum]